MFEAEFKSAEMRCISENILENDEYGLLEIKTQRAYSLGDYMRLINNDWLKTSLFKNGIIS